MRPRRPPSETHAYLVGGGIASLSAAVHLHHDAGVPASQIHIIEAAPQPGGSMGRLDSREDSWKRGYTVIAARKLNFSYRCLYDTLALVPSMRHQGQSIYEDLRVTASEPQSTNGGAVAVDPAASFPARLVANGPDGPEIVNVQSMGLTLEQRMSLLGLILAPEASVASGGGEIQAHFQPDFFESKFWDVWASLYAFQPWHSAIEFRRYLLRFLHEFSHISTLEGTDHAPLNDYESIILPIEQHLKGLGVDFLYNTHVSKVVFAPGETIHVSQLRMHDRRSNVDRDVAVGDNGIVLLTLGSMTSSVLFGANDRPPPPLPAQEAVLRDPGPVWRFWETLADPATNPAHHAAFGRPQTFCSHVAKSSWLSFTVTLSGAATGLFDHLAAWAGFGDSGNNSCSSNSNGPLITFRDSPWMMSITMPCQPYFTTQPADVRVLWGYGLYPDQEGLAVRKTMMACTGAEIFAELVSFLDLPPSLAGLRQAGQGGAAGAITIPCLMPFIGSPFLARSAGDRPDVLPQSTDNVGLIGQFVEMDRDVTFTMEYSARSAQMAVFGLMGLDRAPPVVHRSDRDVQVLGEMMMTIMS